MATESAPYFWLVCDKCGARSTYGSDYSAWADHGQAADQAVAANWTCNDEGDWCEDCAPVADEEGEAGE